MNEHDIPLFRTLALVTVTQAATPQDAAAANGAIIVNRVGDVTQWVGRNVSKRLYDEIAKRCSNLNFSIEHNAIGIGDLFHITKIHAYPSKP